MPSSPCRPRSPWASRSTRSLPDDRLALYRNAVAGPETKTLLVYDEPFWRADGFSGQTAEPRSAAEVTLDASPASGKPGVIASFTFGPVAERLDALDPAERRGAVLGALAARLGPRAAAPIDFIETAVVERGVDARLLDGSFPARHPHSLRTVAARTVRSRALGRHRDVDDVTRRDRRRGPLGAARRRGGPRPHLNASAIEDLRQASAQVYMSEPGVVSNSPVSSHVFRPERIIGQPP